MRARPLPGPQFNAPPSACAVRALSVVLPAFNEAANLEAVVASCRAYLDRRLPDHELLVVDDGSTDGTWSILARLAAADARIRPLRHSANRGYGAALRTGFAAATRPFVFFMDTDGQFDVADLDRVLALATDDRTIVAGFRARRSDSLSRRLNARLFGLAVRLVLGVRVRDVNCAFKLLPRAVLERVPLESTGALINAELLARAVRQGFGIEQVAVSHLPRRAGAQTGARLSVILRAFAELAALRRRIVSPPPAGPGLLSSGDRERRPPMPADTAYTLDEFLADTRATIRTKGIPSGLAEIRDHLERLLHNPELLKKHLGDPVPYTERTTIGHDPETDVHVLVHGRPKAGKSSVHDHGPCWVIYGNYRNPTRMRRWRRLDDGARPGYAEVELQREFLNEAGQACAFAVGDIHSIEFGDDTFFIRVTGGDVETKQTQKFDPERKTVEVADRAQGQR